MMPLDDRSGQARQSRARVRIAITPNQLDDYGDLAEPERRTIRARLFDIPASVWVIIDLGPLHRLQELLVWDLSTLPCGHRIIFEGPDWTCAARHEEMLNARLGVPA